MAAQINNPISAAERKRGIRRSLVWTSLLAATFYVGFILLGVLNSP